MLARESKLCTFTDIPREMLLKLKHPIGQLLFQLMLKHVRVSKSPGNFMFQDNLNHISHAHLCLNRFFTILNSVKNTKACLFEGVAPYRP